MEYQYIKSSAIITEFKRGKRKIPFNDSDMKAFIDTDIKKLLKDNQKEFKIALIRNINRVIELPKDFYKITQVLYLPNDNYAVNNEAVKSLEEQGIEIEDCMCEKPDPFKNPCNKVEKELTFRNYSCDNNCLLDLLFKPNFLMYSNVQVYDLNKNQLQKPENIAYIMRPRSNNFYNINHHLSGCLNLNADTVLSYDMKDNTEMNINTDGGFVLLSYLANKLDESGYLLIPDDPFVQEALLMGIEERVAKQLMLSNPTIQNYRSIWRDFSSMKPGKFRAAELQLRTISTDKLSLLLKMLWDTHGVNRNSVGEYKTPQSLYPNY